MSSHHILHRAIGAVALLCVIGQAGSQEWLRWDESRPSRDEDPAKILPVQQQVPTNVVAKTPAVPVVVQPAPLQTPLPTVLLSSATPAAVTIVEPIPEQIFKVEEFVAANAIPVSALAPVPATAPAVEPVAPFIVVPASAPVSATTSSIQAVVATLSPEAPVVVSPVISVPVDADSITVAPTAALAIAKPIVSQQSAVERVVVTAKPLVLEQQTIAALVVASEELPAGDSEGFVANAIPAPALEPVSATANPVEPIVAAIAVPASAPVSAATSSFEVAVVAAPSAEVPVVVNPVIPVPVGAKPIVSQQPAVERVAVTAKSLVPQQQPLAALVVATEEQLADEVEGFVAANALPLTALAPVSAAAPGSDSGTAPSVIEVAETTTQPLTVSRGPSVTISEVEMPASVPEAFDPPSDAAALEQQDIEAEMKRRPPQGP